MKRLKMSAFTAEQTTQTCQNNFTMNQLFTYPIKAHKPTTEKGVC